jgi:hypothetical protein
MSEKKDYPAAYLESVKLVSEAPAIRAELLNAVRRLQPAFEDQRDGEGDVDFVGRLTTEVGQMPDAAWETLSAEAQRVYCQLVFGQDYMDG